MLEGFTPKGLAMKREQPIGLLPTDGILILWSVKPSALVRLRTSGERTLDEGRTDLFEDQE